METVRLKVTTNSLEQKAKATNQEQIALKSTFRSISMKLAQASKKNQVCIRLANAFELKVGDTSAIWRAHNNENQKDFDRLFAFLSEKPDQEMEFICSIMN